MSIAHTMATKTTFWQHPLLRMAAASLAVVLPLALSFALLEALVPKALRVAWPNAVAALACIAGYWGYVSRFEHRAVAELGGKGALAEVCRGCSIGAGLGLLSLAPLWAMGLYTVTGAGDAWLLLRALPAMALVAILEEFLMRGVLFRLSEAAWGSRRALALTTLLFTAGHLPGGQITAIGLAVTAAASVALTAGYMHTRRLWLPIGMHFGWNYLFDAVFSVPVSGHEAKGWLQARLTGPDWLSGGAYGVEASVVALVVWTLASALLVRRVSWLGKR
jgi:uncharacterized protein